MKKAKTYSGIGFLIGVCLLSPVTYSVVLYEMAVVQRMFFFSISLLLFFIYLIKVKNQDKILLNKSLVILILIFPLTFLTSFFNNSSSLLILKLSEIIVPICIMVQTAILIVILGEERFFKVIGNSVVIISTLFSIVGILEIFQIKILPLPTIISPGSTLGHRSFAAEYLLSSLPFFLIVNSFIKKENKVYLFIAAIVNVSFLLFTRNRSGLLILIVIALFYLVYIFLNTQKDKKFKSLVPVISVLIISFAISFIPMKGIERPDLGSTAETILDTEYKSNVLRLKFWEASLQMISEYPISGIGIFKWSGHFPKYYGEYFTDENVTYVHNVHAHNDFLEIFTESGFFASLVFLFIYLLIIYSLFRKVKLNQNYFPLLLTFLITFAYSLIAFPNHKFSSYFLAAISAGVSLIIPAESEKTKFGLKFNYFKWLLFLGLVIGTTTSYIRLKSELRYSEAIGFKDIKQYGLMIQKLDDVSKIFYPLDASKQPVDYYRGIANYYLRKYADALKNNLEASELAPFNPIVMRNVGSLYNVMNDKVSAVNLYEKMCIYFPNYIGPQINLLNIYTENNQPEKSKLLYEELKKKSNMNPRLIEYENKYLKK